ncbi:alpha/beta fold hydrolase [Amycolatopsis sp. NPDC051903]|uniref:alpha/beta fold hydrolase n=1 Tax=Amycolatopsis sp. NPDC051903 TaxID=3363936 RepID=UPI003797E696
MISRRQFSQVFAAGVATASIAGYAPGAVASAATGGRPEFGPLKQVRAGVLDIGYVELGPAHGPVVILLHGWPYDIHSFADVAPALAARGYRVLVPYLRGYGTTTFRSGSTFRNAQQSAVAADVIALMDALHIRKAVLGGFDWGSRTAGAVAALWPERCQALVLVSGYLITNLKAQLQPLAPAAELGWWYQYYFSTERGVLGYTQKTDEFTKLIWQTVSPKWHFDDATYQRTAQSFTNPDHVAIVVHNYRWRLSLAPGEPQYDRLEAKLQQSPKIALPTITIASDFDGAAADGSGYRAQFTGKYDHRILPGIGHNVPQEAPADFTQAIVDAARL